MPGRRAERIRGQGRGWRARGCAHRGGTGGRARAASFGGGALGGGGRAIGGCRRCVGRGLRRWMGL